MRNCFFALLAVLATASLLSAADDTIFSGVKYGGHGESADWEYDIDVTPQKHLGDGKWEVQGTYHYGVEAGGESSLTRHDGIVLGTYEGDRARLILIHLGGSGRKVTILRGEIRIVEGMRYLSDASDAADEQEARTLEAVLKNAIK